MKKNIPLMVFLSAILSAATLNGYAEGYELTGHIKGLKEGTKVMMVLIEGPASEGMDSAYVKDGSFLIKGVVPHGPRCYNMKFEGTPHWFWIYVQNGDQITVNCSMDIHSLDSPDINDFIDVVGAPYQYSAMAIQSANYLYDRIRIELNKCIKRLSDSVGFDPHLLEGLETAKGLVDRSAVISFFTDNPTGISAQASLGHLVAIDWIYRASNHGSFIADRYKKMSEEERKSFYGQRLAFYAPLCIGESFPEFAFPTIDGSLMSVKDLYSKSKVIVVNFWGTNSTLTSANHDFLRKMYNRYHAKGLNVIAVSSDDSVAIWKKWLGDNNYPWYNVIDKKGGLVDSVYHELTMNLQKIRNVTNVVIGANGKILAWDVDDIELQYYLWKELEEEK